MSEPVSSKTRSCGSVEHENVRTPPLIVEILQEGVAAAVSEIATKEAMKATRVKNSEP